MIKCLLRGRACDQHHYPESPVNRALPQPQGAPWSKVSSLTFSKSSSGPWEQPRPAILLRRDAQILDWGCVPCPGLHFSPSGCVSNLYSQPFFTWVQPDSPRSPNSHLGLVLGAGPQVQVLGGGQRIAPPDSARYLSCSCMRLGYQNAAVVGWLQLFI